MAVARANKAPAAAGRRRRAPTRRVPATAVLSGADRPAWLLLGAWLVYRLHPYVPALDLGKYWHAIRPVLLDPLPHGGDPFRWCLMWLLCCMLVEAVAGPARTARLFPIFAGAIFAARVVIAEDTLASADIAGACVAYVLWLLLFRRAPARNAILAVFFAAMLVALRLQPPLGFGWLALVEKAFLYGGLIWLLGRAGLRPVLAVLATAALLLLTGLAAAHGLVRTGTLTNAGLALAVGAAFAASGLSLPRPSRP